VSILEKHGFSIQAVYGIPFLTMTKVMDKLSLSLLGRTLLPFKIANSLDRHSGRSPLKRISLQFDIIAQRK
jgi:hypothetical protein